MLLGTMISFDGVSSFIIIIFFGSFSQSPFTPPRIKDVTDGFATALAA